MSERPSEQARRPVAAGAPADGDPTVGRVLADRYRVDTLLARGGMARVYRARDVRLDRDVAIKVLSPPYADDPDFVARFLGEARAAASISHPSLVHVYDSGSDDAIHYIVMELLDRHRSLREVLDQLGRLGVADAVGMARGLLAGLHVVHERGLVHCDVKSANVMLGPGPAKLIDFGIARTPAVTDGNGRRIGSLRSMAPEQLAGGPLTPATDLFAMGVVLYEALTGRLPYEADTPEQLAEAHAAGEVRPPSTMAPGIPGRLDVAILQALRIEPAARFRSARALDRALASALEPRDVEETRSAPVAAPPPGGGYVPPPAPPPARTPVAQPGRGGAVPFAGRVPVRRRSIAGLIGTALVLSAALLVGLLVVAPLLQLGGGPGDGDAPPGSGTPAPGATATPAGNVVAVPNTIGMSKDDAIAAANGAGLRWTIECLHDESRPEGIVDQQPAPDTEVERGSRFTMYSARISDCR